MQLLVYYTSQPHHYFLFKWYCTMPHFWL